MEDSKDVSTPAEGAKFSKDGPNSSDEKAEMSSVPYRSLIGSLMYLANTTRPDIAFAVNRLARCVENPSKAHWVAAKRVLRRSKCSSYWFYAWVWNYRH